MRSARRGREPYAANLLDNISKRNLRVDRIVSLHGGIAPFADLAKVAAAAATPCFRAWFGNASRNRGEYRCVIYLA